LVLLQEKYINRYRHIPGDWNLPITVRTLTLQRVLFLCCNTEENISFRKMTHNLHQMSNVILLFYLNMCYVCDIIPFNSISRLSAYRSKMLKFGEMLTW